MKKDTWETLKMAVGIVVAMVVISTAVTRGMDYLQARFYPKPPQLTKENIIFILVPSRPQKDAP